MRNCSSCGKATHKKHCDDCSDTGSPWRINEDALERACKILGIKHPVLVKRTASKKIAGRYYGMSSSGEHSIHLSARMSPAMASQTLWHELTHAKQFEEDPNYFKNYTANINNAGYSNSFYEQEAKANEDYHVTRFSLTLANKRVNMPLVKNSIVSYANNGDVVYDMKYFEYMTKNDIAIQEAKIALGR